MDEKKDIIIIVADNDGSGLQAATVFFQKADGSFANDTKLDSEINTTVKNKDVNTIADYIIAKNK